MPPLGIEPSSSVLQTGAMTTSAKAALTYANTLATVEGQCRRLSPKVYDRSFTNVFTYGSSYKN